MAEMNINIINPTISLISKRESTSNKCETLFEFTVSSTPYADIIIAATFPENTLNADDLRSVLVDYGGGYKEVRTLINDPEKYPFIDDVFIKRREFKLNSTGVAKVRLILANSGEADSYYSTTVYVRDETNNKEENKIFTRYNDNAKCKIGFEPIANNDTYSIIREGEKNLDILKNDERLHYIADLNKVNFVEFPEHGSLNFLFGVAKYIHNGGSSTQDSFTYTVQTPDGLSNEATVTINIIQEEVPVVDSTTRMVITFDSSGSMNNTLNSLIEMRNNQLKNKLLSYYNGDENLYNEKVTIRYADGEKYDENFYKAFQGKKEGTSEFLDLGTKAIVIIFQDEADNFAKGVNWTHNDPRAINGTYAYHDNNILELRNFLDNTNIDFKGVMFQVATPETDPNTEPSSIRPFKPYIEAIENGLGKYSGQYGLSDKDKIAFKYDITASSTAQYYTDKIIEYLREQGLDIQ